MTQRPSRFRVGKMRESIDIMSAATDESSGQPERIWSKLYEKQPASWQPTSGGETVNGRQVEAGINAVFTLHAVPGLDTEQRVVHRQRGKTYGIAYVHPVEGGNRFVDLHCKTIEGWHAGQ